MEAAGAATRLAGQVVWITGAASGIGAHLAARFAEAGASVAAIDVQPEPLDRLVEAGGGRIASAVADVSSWPETSAACARLADELGPPQIVVANAGISPPWVAVEDADPADWDQVVGVNLTGAFYVAKAAAGHLRASAPSSLLFTASVMGLGAGPGGAAYHASKHGVIGLMRAMANELSPAGVRVNALCPGWVDTPMLDADIRESGGAREDEVAIRVRQHLLPRLIQPEDVAQAALFLVSPAGAAISGVALPVDAGMLEQRHWVSRDWHDAAGGPL